MNEKETQYEGTQTKPASFNINIHEAAPNLQEGIEKEKLKNYLLYNLNDLKLDENESIINTKKWAVGLYISFCGIPSEDWKLKLNNSLNELLIELKSNR